MWAELWARRPCAAAMCLTYSRSWGPHGPRFQGTIRDGRAVTDLFSNAGTLLGIPLQQEFEAYLKCGRLEEGFLRVRCEQCHAEKLVAFS